MRLVLCQLSTSELPLQDDVERALRAEGFEIDRVDDISDAAWRASESAVAALLLTIPSNVTGSADPIDAVRTLRRAAGTTPIVVLSPDDDRARESALLDAGADDHLTTPVVAQLLIARLHAQRRRSDVDATTAPALGRYRLDASRLTAVVDTATNSDDDTATTVELTQREFAIAELLARRAPQPVDKLTILEAVWGIDFDGDPNVVEVYVGYLRKKLGRATIHTVRGVGYRAGEA